MRQQLKLLPNQLTALRLFLIPVLWIVALLGLSTWVGVGLAVAYLTDILDGYFARKLNLMSSFGAKFDSFADNLLQPSVLIWLWLLKPKVILDHLTLWSVVIAIYVASILVGLIKFRRFANLHLHTSKYGSLITFAFGVHTFIADQYSQVLYYLAMLSSIVSSSETLILQLWLDQVNEHLGSIFLVMAKKRTKNKPLDRPIL